MKQIRVVIAVLAILPFNLVSAQSSNPCPSGYVPLFAADGVTVQGCVQLATSTPGALQTATPSPTSTVDPFTGLISSTLVYPVADQPRIESAIRTSGITPTGWSLATTPLSDSTSAVFADGSLVLQDPAGIGGIEITAGETRQLIIVPLDSTIPVRADAVYSTRSSQEYILTLSFERASTGTEVRVQAITSAGLVDISNGTVSSSASVGRLNGIIHISLFEEQLTNDIPYGYIVTVTAPGSDSTTIALDQNPQRDAIAVGNILTYVPGR